MILRCDKYPQMLLNTPCGLVRFDGGTHETDNADLAAAALDHEAVTCDDPDSLRRPAASVSGKRSRKDS